MDFTSSYLSIGVNYIPNNSLIMHLVLIVFSQVRNYYFWIFKIIWKYRNLIFWVFSILYQDAELPWEEYFTAAHSIDNLLIPKCFILRKLNFSCICIRHYQVLISFWIGCYFVTDKADIRYLTTHDFVTFWKITSYAVGSSV